MRFNIVPTAALSILSSVALAVPAPQSFSTSGYAVVINKCAFTSYLSSVSPSTIGPEQTLEPGASYQEAYQSNGGISIKLSLYSSISSLYNDTSPLTQFQYTLDGSTIWYDLADTHGDTYAPNAVKLMPSDGSCPSVDWAQGSGPSAVNNCGSTANLTLVLC